MSINKYLTKTLVYKYPTIFLTKLISLHLGVLINNFLLYYVHLVISVFVYLVIKNFYYYLHHLCFYETEIKLIESEVTLL